MWRDVAWLFDIVQAATKARAYVAGMDLEDFRRSSLHRDAVLRQLEIIGEATKRLSEETRDRYPSVAWRNVKRARFARRVLHGIRHETREVFPEIRMYLYPIMHQHFTDLLPYLPIDDPPPPVEESTWVNVFLAIGSLYLTVWTMYCGGTFSGKSLRIRLSMRLISPAPIRRGAAAID